MNKKTIVLALLVILATPLATSYADSPITSTDFHTVYTNSIVKRAAELNVVDNDIAEYLSSTNNPIDVKAAVINALSWKFEGKKNTIIYAKFLAKKYNTPASKLDTDMLTADEVFCIGYLSVMDDYFHPERAISILEEAHKRNKKSYTVAMILAITKAQKAMDSDWCKVWKLTEAVIINQSLDFDMLPEAKKIILDYMLLYKDECK